ncbi:hypothetical protein EDB83DRAFT_2519992 [Lactarius deliciosus]|nr:hypothetical protein EDB83DRAFT_2519992 [Lactarius deliciosus]
MHSSSTLVDISIFHLDIPRRRMTPLLPCYISHGSRTPSLSPPSGIGQRASIISELDKACTDSPVSPSFPRMSEMFPSIPTYIVPTQCTVLLPDACHPRPHSPHPHSCTPRPSPRPHLHCRRHASPRSRYHSSLRTSRSWLPVLARVSKPFSAAMQVALYRTLDLSADDADACVARLAGARPSHCARLPARARPILSCSRWPWRSSLCALSRR